MIKLYNTLTKKKQPFKSIKKGQVSMYTCGPTVYQYAHIGNLRAYLAEDILRRTLEYNGYKVKQVMNITDVGHLTSDADTGEDKVEQAAKRSGKTVGEITKHFANLFVEDLKKLNIKMPKKFAWASKYIKEQIALIQKLGEKGYTYQTYDGIYFDTAKFKNYGKLGKVSTGKARVAHSKEKKRENDFALWKFAQFKIGHQLVGGVAPKASESQRLQRWDYPSGKMLKKNQVGSIMSGYPGWHIECSAISSTELGQPFDIHTGGEDHIAIHHNNEIAQSEAAYDKPLAHYWFHNAFVLFTVSLPQMKDNVHFCRQCGHKNQVSSSDEYVLMEMEDGTISLKVRCEKCGTEFHSGIRVAKMSKSKGAVINLTDLIEQGFDPMVFRYLVISSHYRRKLNFSHSAMESASRSLGRLRAVFAVRAKGGRVCQKCKQSFLAAINDDLNMPKAFKVVWKLVRATDKTLPDKQATLLDFDKVLGLGLKDYKPTIPTSVKKLVAKREAARKKKDFKLADRLRKDILGKGFVVDDTSEGSIVSPK